MKNNTLNHLPFNDLKEMREEMYLVKAYAQIGEIDTNLSLKYGVLPRDPMRSHDMMQLCYSLPIECFSAEDYDRRLVRAGMAGIVPECIRTDIRHRGRQSGDMYYRMRQVWDQMKPEISAMLSGSETLEFLSKEKMDDWFGKLTAENLEENANETLMMVDAYSFALYLKQLEKMHVL